MIISFPPKQLQNVKPNFIKFRTLTRGNDEEYHAKTLRNSCSLIARCAKRWFRRDELSFRARKNSLVRRGGKEISFPPLRPRFPNKQQSLNVGPVLPNNKNQNGAKKKTEKRYRSFAKNATRLRTRTRLTKSPITDF